MPDVTHEVLELWIELTGEPPAIRSEPRALLDALIESLPEPPLGARPDAAPKLIPASGG